MQVNKIDNSQTFQSTYRQKIIKASLKDDSEALVRISFDKVSNQIKSLEGYQFKKGEYIGGKGIGKPSGLKNDEILNFFGDLQENAKEGINFFKELAIAMLKR